MLAREQDSPGKSGLRLDPGVVVLRRSRRDRDGRGHPRRPVNGQRGYLDGALRAQELGNASAARRELGVSRSLYYRLPEEFVVYGAPGLHPKRRTGRLGRPPRLLV
jgi:hypothetical protein